LKKKIIEKLRLEIPKKKEAKLHCLRCKKIRFINIEELGNYLMSSTCMKHIGKNINWNKKYIEASFCHKCFRKKEKERIKVFIKEIP